MADKNVERLRRDDVISEELKAVINNVPIQESKVTEKRDSDSEENKKFSVVKIPDVGKNNQTQQSVKLSTIPIVINQTLETSEALNDISSGSGASDSESGSGADGFDGSGSGEPEIETVAKKSDSNIMTNNEAKLAMNIEGSSEENSSGSGSGDEASGSGAADESQDQNPFKRNLETEQSKAVPVASESKTTNSTSQRVNVSLPSPVNINGNVSKVVTINPGGFNEAPMAKEEKVKSNDVATLNEIKYYKPQENKTETLVDKVNNNNLTKFNENSTFLNVVSNAANNQTGKENNSTKTGSKKDTLPDEVSNVADNLFNFENDEEGKAVPAAPDNEDALPGSQGGPIGEDLMSSMTSPTTTTSEKKTKVVAPGNATTVAKKWKVINSEESGSGGVPDEEFKMQVESTIGKSFDASMRKSTDNMGCFIRS